MHADGDYRVQREPCGKVYTADDLLYLESILEEVLADMRRGGAAADQEAGLRSRAAVALFQCVESGQSDRAVLSREALRAAQLV